MPWPSYKNRQPSTNKSQKDWMAHPKTNIAKSTDQILREISLEREIPISKLIAIAIDNELGTENPFQFHYALPSDLREGIMYPREAGRIKEYMFSTVPNGTGLDQLLLCRRDMGIESKEVFLRAFRDLVAEDFIEYFYPQNAKFHYPKTYRFVKLKKEALLYLRNQKYKKIEAAVEKAVNEEEGPI